MIIAITTHLTHSQSLGKIRHGNNDEGLGITENIQLYECVF